MVGALGYIQLEYMTDEYLIRWDASGMTHMKVKNTGVTSHTPRVPPPHRRDEACHAGKPRFVIITFVFKTYTPFSPKICSLGRHDAILAGAGPTTSLAFRAMKQASPINPIASSQVIPKKIQPTWRECLLFVLHNKLQKVR
jgi:hypothetical protein